MEIRYIVNTPATAAPFIYIKIYHSQENVLIIPFYAMGVSIKSSYIDYIFVKIIFLINID